MDAGEHGFVTVPLVLTIVENVGRAASLLLPFFYSLDLELFNALVNEWLDRVKSELAA